MKKINAYEYKDLNTETQNEILSRRTNEAVEIEMNGLSNMLDTGEITEKEYYEQLGINKHYAETTSWFVPACYYEKHKDEIDKEVLEIVAEGLYTSTGAFIQYKK